MTDTTSTPIAKRPLKWTHVMDHLILILGALFMLVPLLMVLQTTTTTDLETIKNGPEFVIGDQFDDNFMSAMFQASGFSGENTGLRMLMNSLILGIGFALGKIVIGMMAAYALVYFRLRFATLAFWLIFTTLLLPLEVRILPSYEVAQKLGLLNTYTGLIVPLIASATATFFFRQFFRSVPEELVEAARIDGAGPVKFFIDILVPLSQTMIAAMFIIMFVFGWNQYLWPTMVTTEEGMFTLVRGIKQLTQDLEGTNIPEYGRANMLALIAILPPVLVVIFFQSWFVKGLTESDK
ncbi:ABC transporter permease subunit [Sulfitobacter sp. M57]|uniref:ABC transporter permease subunit n=1 Tax=unclassified Sulfitobacter TaxID=196795 RepID=UPI0023E0CD1C|nr:MULTISPECIES: ABC transporter permease subunit [unclassified Sulfitobacter]MDF3414400.1 ABC transporter permease subunit [Sulfitobacter sp. KE5]MDF3420318.1 ABC transporter permease subunit [Sulfitobacter sp. KE43]MDF3432946.1 ABC transporter permease subunit [Sulfitobacter sp. KE42]MDF3458586.1 ABC transporter permease subunit [Sulfitobacter sp. S74]MDF3462486.1 ABC transporter permease subunit [Sulfitobacter sp. Ks18]